MTLESIEEIEKRAEAATPGPWWVSPNPEQWVESEHDYPPSRLQDAEFIAHAREDIPALIESLRARDELLAECKNALEEIEHKAGVLYAALPNTSGGERYDVSPFARTAWWVVDRARSVLARFAEKE